MNRCTVLKAKEATVSVRKKQRVLSAFKHSRDCYCTTRNELEGRLKQVGSAWGLVLTQQIEED